MTNRELPTLVDTLPEAAIFTNTDKVMNLARGNSVWYMLSALACCGIELMQAGGPRTDLDRMAPSFGRRRARAICSGSSAPSSSARLRS